MDPVSSKPFSYMKFFSDYVHMIRLCMNVYFNHMRVRTMAKKLVDVQRWAEGVRSCLAKIENHSLGSTNALERADLEYVTELLSFDTMPCNEPGHLKLKEYAEEVKKLAGEIESTLSSSSKEWLNRVRICLLEKRAAAIEIDSLYKLKSEIRELHNLLPETEMLLELLGKTETYRDRCAEILKGPIYLEVLAAVIKASASRENEILAEIRDAVFTFICKMESKRVMDTMLVSRVRILYIRSLLARSPEL